jgi:thiol-disulfide isomerase/thioredoxin
MLHTVRHRLAAVGALSLAAIAALALVFVGGTPVTPTASAEAAAVADDFPDNAFPRNWHYRANQPEAFDKMQELVGKLAPDIDTERWTNIPGGRLGNLRGDIVVLDFWATWCGPCIASIPKLNDLQKKYADDNVTILGICSPNGGEKMAQIVSQHNIEYPVAIDQAGAGSGVTSQRYGVSFFPYIVLVGRDGVVRAAGITPSKLEAAIDRLISIEAKRSGNTGSGDDTTPGAAGGDTAQINPAWLEGTDRLRSRLRSITDQPAPDLHVENWMNSEPLELDELRGKVVMVDFWATWCRPCRRAIPGKNSLHKRYADQGLVIIGVCHPRNADRMASLVESENIAYPVAVDARSRTRSSYKVDGYPDTYFIDRAGNLRVADAMNDSLEPIIQALLAEPAPDEANADRPAGD